MQEGLLCFSMFAERMGFVSRQLETLSVVSVTVARSVTSSGPMLSLSPATCMAIVQSLCNFFKARWYF